MRQGNIRLWNSAGGSGQAQVHDHERTDAVRIGKCKAETSRAAPIVTNHGRVANVELSQQARQVCDVAVETVRLFADRLLG